jgi:hypothetical protein
MLALPCEAACDRYVTEARNAWVRREIGYDRYLVRTAYALDLLADAGLIPDEPEEAR